MSKKLSSLVLLLIAASGKPALIKVSSQWCGTCIEFDKDLQTKIAPAFPTEVKLIVIDIERSVALAKQIGAGRGMPHFSFWCTQKDREERIHVWRARHQTGYGPAMASSY